MSKVEAQILEALGPTTALPVRVLSLRTGHSEYLIRKTVADMLSREILVQTLDARPARYAAM